MTAPKEPRLQLQDVSESSPQGHQLACLNHTGRSSQLTSGRTARQLCFWCGASCCVVWWYGQLKLSSLLSTRAPSSPQHKEGTIPSHTLCGVVVRTAQAFKPTLNKSPQLSPTQGRNQFRPTHNTQTTLEHREKLQQFPRQYFAPKCCLPVSARLKTQEVFSPPSPPLEQQP